MAGLTLGRACLLAGIPFLLFERSPVLLSASSSNSSAAAVAGTGLGLWGPAERVLAALGVGEEVRSKSRRMGCAGYRVATTGAWLAQPPSTPDSAHITACLTIPRAELQRILLHSLPPHCVLLDHAFATSHTDQQGEVSVTFHNGRTYKGSLLVAADGINSAVRAQYRPEINAKYCGYAYYRAMTQLPTEALEANSPSTPPAAPSPCCASPPPPPSALVQQPTRWSWPLSTPDVAWESWGVSTRIAFVPLRDRLAFWFVSTRMTEAEADATAQRLAQANKQQTEQGPAAASLTIDQLLPGLDSSEWHAPIRSLLTSTLPANLVFTPIRRVEMSPSLWTLPSSRVVFLGDAAHAVPPNLAAGGMMSIQDSMQLASSLRTAYAAAAASGGTVPLGALRSALDEYVEARQWPVRVIQLCSALVAEVGQLSSPSLIRLRDFSIQLVPFALRNVLFRFLHRFYLGMEYTPPSLGQGLYARLMPRQDWERLPGLLKAFHSMPPLSSTSSASSSSSSSSSSSAMSNSVGLTHVCEGEATCRVGPSLVAQLASRGASMPPALASARVHVAITQHPDGSETWHRTFAAPPAHPPSSSSSSSATAAAADAADAGGDASTQLHHFHTHQYIEGSHMVEAVPAPFVPGLAQVEFLFNVQPMPQVEGAHSRGFEHVLRRTRLRLVPSFSFPFSSSSALSGVRRGGVSIPRPRFAQPVLHAQTLLSECLEATSWTFDIRVRAPDNALTKWIMDNELDIAGYSGTIHKFEKHQVKEWIKQQKPMPTSSSSSSSDLNPSIKSATAGQPRAFSTTSRHHRRSSLSAVRAARLFSTSASRLDASTAATSSPSAASAPVPASPASPPRFRVLILGGYGLFGQRVAGGLLLRAPSPSSSSSSSSSGGLAGTVEVLMNARHSYPKAHADLLAHVRSKAHATFPLHAPTILQDLDARLVATLFDASNSATLQAKLKQLQVHVVVNCVGPFQGSDYRIAQACIDSKVHYIDLADGRAFVCGFAKELDAQALAQGVTLISGASSVPGLSSAVVALLASTYKLDCITRIDMAISPGNHTPRGLATMQSILGQVGRTLCHSGVGGLFRENSGVVAWGLGNTSRAPRGHFSPSINNPRRWLSPIDVPDLQLFPKHFATDTACQRVVPNVSFRAGLESPLMHLGLVALGWLVRLGVVRDLAPYAPLLKRLAELPAIMALGSNTGGMYVRVEGTRGRRPNAEEPAKEERVAAVWRLYAGSGEGPQIPATASVVLCSQLQRQWLAGSFSPSSSSATSPRLLPAGAYPCLELFSVDDFLRQLEPYDIHADVVVEESDNDTRTQK